MGRFSGVFAADLLTSQPPRRPRIGLRRAFLSGPADLVDSVRRKNPRFVASFHKLPTGRVRTATGTEPRRLRRHAKLAEKVQSVFTKHLEGSGWPAHGLMSNADVFDQIVEPMLKESGRRVAYILVDALRYELGVTLHRQLWERASHVGPAPTSRSSPSLYRVQRASRHQPWPAEDRAR